MSLAEQGLAIKAGFEIEWVLAADDSENFKPAVEGAGYGCPGSSRRPRTGAT